MVFLEIKKKGAKMSPKENRLRKIIDSKNVEYKVIDVSLPDGTKIEERVLPVVRKPKMQREILWVKNTVKLQNLKISTLF